PEVARLISVLSLCIPIQGLAVVQSTILNREMNFKALSVTGNTAALVSGVIGIGMAFTGFGAWALVGPPVAEDGVSLVLLWRLSSWRPRLEFSWRHLRSLVRFSVSNFTAQLALFAEASSAPIFLGLFFGPIAVGLYRLADRLVNSVMQMAMSSI